MMLSALLSYFLRCKLTFNESFWSNVPPPLNSRDVMNNTSMLSASIAAEVEARIDRKKDGLYDFAQ